ncbi:hypothetical protein LguiA_008046 [Lonicera macranthoides]
MMNSEGKSDSGLKSWMRDEGGSFFSRSLLPYQYVVRFFMTWISPSVSFGDRELFAIETLFKSHPNACLIIVTNSIDSIREMQNPWGFLEANSIWNQISGNPRDSFVNSLLPRLRCTSRPPSYYPRSDKMYTCENPRSRRSGVLVGSDSVSSLPHPRRSRGLFSLAVTLSPSGSCSGFLVDTLVHIPSTPSVFVNNDGEASLRGAVVICIRDGLRIMVLKGVGYV